MNPLFIGGLGATELLIILAVLVLLFGATKLPELARGSGRALRIFKDETRSLTDGSDSADSAASADAAGGSAGSDAEILAEPRRTDRGPVG
ncbi:twin-arginine translocase TatA/TatE family subunit [Nocardioides sp. YIM 152315]|uniref:twin-arginine translocase TatA/TatE family subunit n=1 Tax=Nocardioides sp. YIM 152315 TaxID=3031760 RepID=UPI0023DCB8CD|nr:twin-arginine translocase TatA/TatE family subunit [Nocardioides sp. YIM 152315]MDF1605744.1 twin-arginine translocase TatA/TatE family subunit [Nocardioides sp. YIM 152315]